MSLKFHNPEFNILCKNAFHVFFAIKCEEVMLILKWGHFGIRKNVMITLYTLSSQETKTIHKIYLWLFVCHHNLKMFFLQLKWSICKIDNCIWKCPWYMPDLLFFFFLNDSNVWCRFLHFAVTLIAIAFHTQIFLIVLTS